MAIFILPVVLVVVVLLAVLLKASYVKAPPDEVFIISGVTKEPRTLQGKAGFKIPFFERLDTLSMALIPIDVKTSSEVPTADYINVRVDSNVNVKIMNTPDGILKASVNFLNQPIEKIGAIARQTLEGNMREIVGQMKLESMVNDRQEFARLVRENAAPDLEAMGLEIVSFNVQNFEDRNGVIENLGVDNIVRIQKSAAISRAESERDIAEAKARAAQQANDAEVAAAEAIAKRQAELDQKTAELKREVDTKKAIAEAAMKIEAENQRKLKDVAATEADIAKAQRETELKQKQIELKEYELDALVRKQADAEKYAAEKKAEAELIRRQKDAEAKAYEMKQKAEAQKAEADAAMYAAQKQAEGIKAVGDAEAEAILKKAEAQKAFGEASVLEMYFNMIPRAIASAAGPLENVDKITLYGEGNSAKMVKDIMTSGGQVVDSIGDMFGIDMKAAMGTYIATLMANKE